MIGLASTRGSRDAAARSAPLGSPVRVLRGPAAHPHLSPMIASCSRLTLLTVTWRLATFVDCGISDGLFLSTATWWSSGSASDVAGTEPDAPRYVSVYPWLSGIGPPTALPREDDVNHRGEASAAQHRSRWGVARSCADCSTPMFDIGA